MAETVKKKRRATAGTSGSVKAKKDLAQQGRAAKALLENTTLQKALSEMKENARDWIEDSQPHEVEKREDLYRFIRSINTLNKLLKVYFTKGSNAAHQLEEIINGGTERSPRS